MIIIKIPGKLALGNVEPRNILVWSIYVSDLRYWLEIEPRHEKIAFYIYVKNELSDQQFPNPKFQASS